MPTPQTSPSIAVDDSIIYPDSDGQPMSDNTKQFRWITTIKTNLDCLLSKNSQVFVAGDLLWYPIQGDNKTRTAPDVMVAFGRPKGDRGSYQQWKEDNIAPQVVFEVLSPGNTSKEMAAKLEWYDHYGVEEYYVYDPDNNQLQGWLRSDRVLQAIPQMQNWVSPRLGIEFDPAARPEMQIYSPDGLPFITLEELSAQSQAQVQQLQEQDRQLQEQNLALQEQSLALQEKDRELQAMAAKLRALGIDP
jgi:Uma2 family endonuclease